MSSETLYSKALLPGSTFPAIVVKDTTGQDLALAATGQQPKLVVFYRGAFCPFCESHLAYLKAEFTKLSAENIQVVIVSADTLEAAIQVQERHGGFPFPLGFGLTVPQMKTLGLFISHPRNYQPQKQEFSEPAYFLLTSDNKIKYMELASMPMGGRVNIDNLIAGYKWSLKNIEEHPEFASVVWGSVPNHWAHVLGLKFFPADPWILHSNIW